MSSSTFCIRIENSAVDLGCFPVGTLYNDLTTGWATEELWIDSRKERFFLLQYVRKGSGSSPTSFPWGWGLFMRRESGRGVKMTTHLHLVPKLGMRGAVLPLSFVFVWRGLE